MVETISGPAGLKVSVSHSTFVSLTAGSCHNRTSMIGPSDIWGVACPGASYGARTMPAHMPPGRDRKS